MLLSHQIDGGLFEILYLQFVNLIDILQDDRVGIVPADVCLVIFCPALGHFHITALADVKFHFAIGWSQLRPILAGKRDPFSGFFSLCGRLLFGFDKDADFSGEEGVGA